VNPSVKKKLSYILFFLLAALLLFFAFRGVDFRTMVEGFRNANYWWVALSLILGFVAHSVRALRWRLLIEPLGHNPSFLNTLSALIIGYMANIAFPRLGEITRCGSLRKSDNIPFDSLLGTVIVERAFDVLMILLLVLTVFLIRIEFFGRFIWDQVFVPIGEKIGSALNFSPFLLIGSLVILVFLIFMVRRNIFGKKFRSRLSSMYWGVIDGLKSVYTMKKRKTFFGYTILLWVLYWLMTWVLVFATAPTSHLGIIDGLFIMVIGSLGMAAPVQGGFGAYHIITAMGLGIYGISREDGLVFATISHESQTVLMLATGIVFLLMLFLRNRKIEAKQD
jgi:hypothetical protein